MTTTAAATPNDHNNSHEANRTSEAVRQSAERERQRENLRKEEAIRKTFEESGIHFKVSPEKVLSTVGPVRLNADGVPVTDGGVPLVESLRNTARVNPMLIAEGWQDAYQPEALVKSKSDLKTAKEKSDYITQFGETAFARLPLTAPQELDESTLTFESYRRLPAAVKSKLIEKHGEDFSTRLLKAQQEQNRLDRLNGVPVGQKKKTA